MTMQQLSGVDATFLYMETPNQFGHVSSLTLYDPTDADPGAAGYEATKRRIEARMHELAPFRRRIVVTRPSRRRAATTSSPNSSAG